MEMAKASTRNTLPAGPHYSELSLAGAFSLASPMSKLTVGMSLPGDVHTALLEAGEIPDPYFGNNEKAVMWVNETPWTVERRFDAQEADIDGYLTLTLEGVDCIATVRLNGEVIAETQNAFIRYDVDVTGKVIAGENTLRIDFAVTPDVAKARYDAHPFPIPFTNNYKTNGLKGIHMNFVRKAACHAGWDWGICLMPIGVYGRWPSDARGWRGRKASRSIRRTARSRSNCRSGLAFSPSLRDRWNWPMRSTTRSSPTRSPSCRAKTSSSTTSPSAIRVCGGRTGRGNSPSMTS
jgi:hypothetical protein